jgi:DNA-binding LytR/AlgR family response regulator
MRVLIADDEPLALEGLKLALQCMPDAEIVGTAKTGKQTLALIRELRPDVAILDIQMPAKNGFEVIQSLGSGEHVPEIIFVTAFHEHAVRAFEVHAVDYLLKPVAFNRLRESMKRAKMRLEARASEELFAELQQLLQSLTSTAMESSHGADLWVPDRGGLTRIDLASVDRIEAEGDYARVFAGKNTHLIKETIASLAARLDPSLLLRVHRSTIVNIDKIGAVRRRRPRGVFLLLNSGEMIAVGPSYVADVQETLRVRRWRS